MRLVKQPEARAANDHRSEGGATPLPRRKIPHRNVTQAFGDAEAVERRRHRFVVDARCTSPETQVLLDGQVVIERRVVPEQPDRPSHGSAVGHQIVAQHLGPAGLNPQQAGADPQQGRLAGAVGSLDEHDLALTDLEIGARERRKPAEQGDDALERNDGHHETLAPPRRRSGVNTVGFCRSTDLRRV